MKIQNIYPIDAVKLCHRKPGDVVRVHKNDISEPDNALYMVIKPDDDTLMNLVDIITGVTKYYHTSTRCTHYKDATLQLNKGFDDAP